MRAVAPGQVWTTSNPDASIESFGADAASPSEDNHIQQLREAMDKTSAVNPIAAGVLRARVGRVRVLWHGWADGWARGFSALHSARGT